LDLKGYQLKVENIEVVTEFDPDLPQFFGNASQIEQVILNLIANAERKIGEHGGHGTITLRTLQAPNRILIHIEDDGPSIPDDLFQKVLQIPFPSRDIDNRFTIGLAICNGIVAELGGWIRAENLSPERGVRFLVELPLILEGEEGKETDSKQEPGFDGSGKVVLVVDDEESIVDYLGKIFRKNNFEVESATNGKKALEIVQKRKIDLIVSDVKMPDINGIDLIKKIRKIRPVLSKKVVFISGATDSNLEEMLGEPDIRYIQKPFGRNQILETVRDIFSPN
jgi:CheY-like chemotaxis protein